jgi:D-tyrosyl-tRNA(Tyr) deacylase
VRAVVQRVRRAAVTVADETKAHIGTGLLVLLGVAGKDTEEEARFLAQKIATLRIFEDDAYKMNRSVQEAGGEVLVVSQFTLYGDCTRGRRPDFFSAAPADTAEPLYERFCLELEHFGLRVARGVFGARMGVELVNDGPVTLIVEKNR